MDQTQKEKYMLHALRLAAKGGITVAPNPRVGAVIVKDNAIIGKGYHKRFGGPHAEVNALSDCRKKGHDPAGATMFVTLEPCCHQGKTGPCTQAIIEAGISRVVIATLDDCQLVAGKGKAILEEAGIAVETGLCEKEARTQNTGFFTLQKHGRPQVILKWAQSIDGKLSWPRRHVKADHLKTTDRTFPWLTGEKARRHVHQVRSECGGILVGIGTVLADNPLLNVRYVKTAIQPLRIVLDSRLRIPFESRLVQTATKAPVYVYALPDAVAAKQDKVDALDEAGCLVIPTPGKPGRISLPEVLADLVRRGVNDLLVEGGADVLQSFQEHKLADKLLVYIAPVIIGDELDATRIAFPHGFGRLTDVKIRHFDSDIVIEARPASI